MQYWGITLSCYCYNGSLNIRGIDFATVQWIACLLQLLRQLARCAEQGILDLPLAQGQVLSNICQILLVSD